MAEVSRARMDFPSYPVDIVLPSFNPADTAHRQFFLAFRKDQKACSKRCNAVRRVRGLAQESGAARVPTQIERSKTSAGQEEEASIE
jgi:hypothetical protein